MHDDSISKLVSEVSSLHASKTPFRINHGSSNSVRVKEPGTPTLNIAHLNHILSISPEHNITVVEPNVSLDVLLSETLKQGLMPPVVMEFPGITVGGGFSSVSGESTCWKEGSFDNCIDEIEIILGDGTLVQAVKGGKNADLFDAARCSMGTLGVVTLLKVRLVDAKPFVEVTYHRTSSIKELIGETVAFCNDRSDGLDFVEGIAFSKTHGTVIVGRMVEKRDAHLPLQRFDCASSPWFYRHARAIASVKHTEVVPLYSYLFRYDRGAFWTGESFFNYWGISNNRFWRTLCNPFLNARASYRSMHAVGGPGTGIVQDLIIPAQNAETFISWVEKDVGIWPLWVCPVRRKDEVWGSAFWKGIKEKKFDYEVDGSLTLNIGIWGAGPDSYSDFLKVNRQMEHVLRQVHGMKISYAQSFYTEDELWELYDKDEYQKARKKWNAQWLPSVWDKINRRAVETEGDDNDTGYAGGLFMKILMTWPIGGIYTSWKSLGW
ncbi:FAD-binding domain-containing protein [Pleomassaria siparia CBS 279.74]|uniref:Delta(24)-sterol reductase n=1 Tax=Pleomassaria siparia CBS 279.74 TaxID=1314801 RepID=A0A6G1JUK7_9PLEO|nr:FAD-binding domain-containing protein [Pleomassaria siparia CBS 279.74]